VSSGVWAIFLYHLSLILLVGLKYWVLGVIFISLLIVPNLMKDSEKPSTFSRWHENGREVFAFFGNWIKPVYVINDGFDNWDELTMETNSYHFEIDEELKVLSWNVYRGYDLNQFKISLNKLIEENNFGVITLQEAPLNVEPFWDDFSFNSFYAPFHQVKKQTKLYNFNSSGQLTLSKYPFTKTEVFELPTVTNFLVGTEHITKRIVTYVQIEKDNKKIGIYNVHLENCATSSSREKQIKVLLDKLKENNDDIVILSGDFNFIFGQEKGIKLIENNGFKKLFDSKLPKLDYFFVKGTKANGFQLKASGSDHNPIGMKIKFD
jgi:endonuclease/exonuclease/phosphatase family metal-dependent hydrolase